MSIKGFTVQKLFASEILDHDIYFSDEIDDHEILSKIGEYRHCNHAHYKFRFHTGTYDRNQNPIFEGDLLRSKTCETPFKVESVLEFLLMCGRYEEKNGTPIFDSLEIVKE